MQIRLLVHPVGNRMAAVVNPLFIWTLAIFEEGMG